MILGQKEKEESLNLLIKFLKIPSISATGEGIREAAEFLKDLMKDFGISSSIINVGGNPIVYGEVGKGDKTLIVYNHYDVQPVDPLNEWKVEPFSGKVIGERVYGRGSSDNKGTLIARLYAIKKLLDEDKLNIKIKFIYEGEEEIGSVNLDKFIIKYKDMLNANGVLMEGSGVDSKGRPLIVLGVKGILYVQLEVETGERDVHSSNAPIIYNPAWELIRALNSIYDGERVLIPGFYDSIRPLSKEEEKILLEYDIEPEEIRRSLGVKELKTMDKKELLIRLYTHPSCNIDGLYSGYIGEGSKTIVPHKAFAKIDFRLVPDQDPYKIFEMLKKHLEKIGFKGTIRMLDRGEFPVRTSPNTKIVSAVYESAKEVYGAEPKLIINSPGTQPMDLFVKVLGIKEVISAIGVSDPESRAHAPNESVLIANYYKAIEHMYKFTLNY
ncbi:MAG: M20/M25/M40 family metallo-hydrolase [Sulfolobaceae archaeon]